MTYLADIVAAHRAGAAEDPRLPGAARALAESSPHPRPFAAVLAERAASGLAVIAELKRRSPSKGSLAPHLDVAEAAADYARGGASCLSVLTDRQFFGAEPGDLDTARRAGLPLLRKDFVVCEADVYDTRAMGADAILLIAAALDEAELVGFAEIAAGIGLDRLVEVHDDDEMARALAIGPEMIGVNQRDLATFAVEPGRAARMAASIPPGTVAVAESGIRDEDDARSLASAGYEAILVGESVVRAHDRASAVARLVGHPVGTRPVRSASGAPTEGRGR